MAIELQRFAAGQTDYIARLNADMAMIEAAINALQLGAGTGGTGGAADLSQLFTALCGSTTTLLGVGSYRPVPSGTSLLITAGYVYKASTQTLVNTAGATLSFVAQTPGTLYIVPDATGAPTISASATDAVYSVVWSGAEFGSITRVAPAIYDATEQNNARHSTYTNTLYPSLDDRMEAMEARNVYRVRKIGLSLDGGGSAITTGIKGIVQCDFAGTIVGWSLVADRVGSITIEVCKGTQSPPAIPPADPPIPNTTTDKISADAPILLEASPAGQSASAGVNEVQTWEREIAQWDTILFNVTNVVGVQKVTLYLRVQEA